MEKEEGNNMKTDIIVIDNQIRSFERAMEETDKVVAYLGLSVKDATMQTLMMEEVLSLARSVIGDTQARFWIERSAAQGYKNAQLFMQDDTWQ